MKSLLQRMHTTLGSRKGPSILALAVVLSFLMGLWLSGEGPEANRLPSIQTHAHESAAKEGMIYVCSMSCVPPMQAPGNCPICGMQLIPVYDANSGDRPGPPRIRFTAEALKLAEIQTATVERKPISAGIRLFGQIDYDPAHTATISSFMPGVIDRVYVKRPGVFVRWGQPLFDLSSPDLLETQQDLIEAMKVVPSFLAFQAGIPHAAREMPVQDLAPEEERKDRSPEKDAALKKIGAIRHKLSLLGLPKRDIDELMQRGEATGVATVYSSIYGQVVDLKANEGTYVNRGATIFTLGDPRHVWALLDAYEADYPWLRLNQEVTFETDAYPGETFAGEVAYIEPVFNTKTRSFRLGAISPDQGGRLKAGMLVRAVVHSQLSAEGKVTGAETTSDAAPLVIPASAPLVTGKRAVVYVRVSGEQNLFEGREVKLGPRSETHYVVLEGLQEGEEVVKNGSFK
ncbi:MAG: efflux RND transporter periplasmic adaptor subunit, partial [Desulfobacterales bacterium]|nr:efflux RND transporter periplasmic adaptor subunit [Desulfobacterales bacterium]